MSSVARHNWTPAAVIEAISERQAAGLPLSSDIMDRTCGALIGAARRLFGSWNAALNAAGIDPETVRAPRETRNRWSREAVVARIREHAAAGHDLAAHRLAAIDAALVASAPRYCGSWDEALKMAGFDASAIRLTEKWTPERVTERIRELKRQRADLSDLSAEAYDPALYGAAATHFGGWRQAVTAAGIDYDKTRRNRTWDRDRLVEELKRMQAHGVPLNAGSSYLGIYPQIMRFLGGMDEAHRAVGEPPENDGEKLVCYLRQARESAGKSQEALGAAIGRSHRSIGLYESGQIIPSLPVALQISAAVFKGVGQLWKKPGRKRTRMLDLNQYEPLLRMVYGENIPVHKVARELGCSPQNIYQKLNAFDHLVAQITGTSPGKRQRNKKSKPPRVKQNLLARYEPVLRMRYQENKKVQEIAAIIGTTQPNISRILGMINRLFPPPIFTSPSED